MPGLGGPTNPVQKWGRRLPMLFQITKPKRANFRSQEFFEITSESKIEQLFRFGQPSG